MTDVGELPSDQLLERLRRSEGEERRFLLRALTRRADAAPLLARIVLEGGAELRLETIGVLAGPIDAPLAEALAAALAADDARVRQAAARRLADAPGDLAFEPLLGATADPSPAVRKEAVRSLGRIRHEGSTDALVERLRDSDEEVRVAAAVALSAFRDPRSAAALARALADRSWRVRRWAAKALGSLRGTPAPDALIEALSDDVAAVREEAARALGAARDPRAAPRLADALRADPSKEVRLEAAFALSRLDAEIALPVLREALAGESDEEVRSHVEACLHELEHPPEESLQVPPEPLLYGTWLSNPSMHGGSELYRFADDGKGVVEDLHLGVTRDHASFRYRASGDELSFLFEGTTDWRSTRFRIERGIYRDPFEGDLESMLLTLESEPYFVEFGAGEEAVYYRVLE
jgi:HEAT repeat protein